MKHSLDTPPKPAYKIDTGPIPLDVLLVNQPGQPKGACWYRLPSWRVFFDCEALEGVDLRLHRSGESSAVWVLSEASTGTRMFADLPQDDFYIGDEGTMLTEFASSTMKKLTKEKVQKAIAEARERLKEYPPNPFGPRSESAALTLLREVRPYLDMIAPSVSKERPLVMVQTKCDAEALAKRIDDFLGEKV